MQPEGRVLLLDHVKLHEAFPTHALSTPDHRHSIAAYLLMGFAPGRLPMMRVPPYQTV